MWKEPLGNPSDDVRFLEYYHRGASRKAIEKRYKAYIQPEPAINDDVDFFFNKLNLKLPKEIEQAVKANISRWFEKLQHVTYFGKRSIKEELINAILFYEMDCYKDLSWQVDKDLELQQKVCEGERAFLRKLAKVLGIRPTFILDDRYEWLVFDHDKMNKSFNVDVPVEKRIKLRGIMGAGAWKMMIKLQLENYRRYRADAKRGINADYLFLLSHFYTLEKYGGKVFLKPYTELVKIWNISSLDTFNHKLRFLRSIDNNIES